MTKAPLTLIVIWPVDRFNVTLCTNYPYFLHDQHCILVQFCPRTETESVTQFKRERVHNVKLGSFAMGPNFYALIFSN